jgi:hypothetical protein
MDARRLWMMWWSGLFAVVAAVHAVRAAASLPVLIGSVEIGLWISWLVFPAAAALSLILLRRARAAKPASAGPRAPWEQLGGCHPCTRSADELIETQAGPFQLNRCYHMVSEDDEPEEAWPCKTL